MVEAFKAAVVCPNKQNEPHLLRKEGKLVESETYVGGHVESLESGVFRSDLPVAFDLDSKAFEKLIEAAWRLLWQRGQLVCTCVKACLNLLMRLLVRAQ